MYGRRVESVTVIPTEVAADFAFRPAPAGRPPRSGGIPLGSGVPAPYEHRLFIEPRRPGSTRFAPRRGGRTKRRGCKPRRASKTKKGRRLGASLPVSRCAFARGSGPAQPRWSASTRPPPAAVSPAAHAKPPCARAGSCCLRSPAPSPAPDRPASAHRERRECAARQSR
jgi:hypothetical protein